MRGLLGSAAARVSVCAVRRAEDVAALTDVGDGTQQYPAATWTPRPDEEETAIAPRPGYTPPGTCDGAREFPALDGTACGHVVGPVNGMPASRGLGRRTTAARLQETEVAKMCTAVPGLLNVYLEPQLAAPSAIGRQP